MMRFLLISILLFLTACTKGPAEKPRAIEFGREHTCEVCGMIIVDFPGAKGQIHYKKGNVDTFCSTLDMFLFYLQPDRPRDIAAVYVNDMGKAGMETEGHWIDAEKAFYVHGGDIMGPMGEAMVPFSELKDAEAYIKQHGGRVLAFKEVTMDMLRPH